MNEMSLPPLPPQSAAKKGKTSENSDQRPWPGLPRRRSFRNVREEGMWDNGPRMSAWEAALTWDKNVSRRDG